MKKTILFVALLNGFFALAQNAKDVENIRNTYDLQKLESLRASFEKNEKDKEVRIAAYLQSNPAVQRKYYVGYTLYEIDDVVNGNPVFVSTDNALAAAATKTNTLYPGGALGLSLEGDGMFVGVWDGGYARRSHVEFGNGQTPSVSRVTFPDTPSPNPATDTHGTHVSGTVGARGVNASAKGMAPKVALRSYNWNFDQAEVTTAAANGLLLSNHSYGVAIYDNSGQMQVDAWVPGCYNNEAKAWDDLMFNAPYYLMVASAGNEGSSSYVGGLAPGFDKLTQEKNSKNNLVVANANPTVNPITGAMTSLVINASSSQGPSDDGRIKPDIAADGTNLFSTSDESDTAYVTFSGTSMASPNTTGTLVLLQQHYHNIHDVFMRAATLKALVCHTALDDAAKAGPDPKFGWGFLNARASAETITAASNNQALVLESNLATNGTYTMSFVADNPTEVKATIAWTDPSGPDRSGLQNSALPALVNDLDLRITKDGTTYFPYKLQLENLNAAAIKGDNVVDNVERVDVASPTTGTYTLTVSHKGTLTNGNQNFSLILTGTNLTLLNTSQFAANDVRVWPNPVADSFNFHFDDLIGEKVSLQLFDVQGRSISVQNDITPINGNTYSVNMEYLPTGVYFVNITAGDKVFKKKFIKK